MTDRWQPVAPRPHRLVHPVPIDPTGARGPTRGQAAGPHWRRTTPGLFVPATVDADRVEQRIVEQAARVRGEAVVTGWAALRLHGAGFFDGLGPDGVSRLPVPIAAGRQRLRPVPGSVLRRDLVPPDEVAVRHGVRCADVHRALFDEMKGHEERDAVVDLDMVLAAELTSLERFGRYVASRRWSRDVRHVRRLLRLGHDASRSPQETRFRLVWVCDAGWDAPLVNRPVHDERGRLIGVPDLLDPRRGVVGEYDGAHHRDLPRHLRDVDREDRFRRAGLEVVTVVGPHLLDPEGVVDRLHAAAARVVPARATWRLGPAPRWTLDQRLALRDHRRRVAESAVAGGAGVE